MLALVAIDFFIFLPVYCYGILIIAYLLALFLGSYRVNSQFFIPTICRARINEKKIALTFDDGPLPKHTPRILEMLRAEGVKATFFCIGKNAAANIDLLKRIHEEGHSIGSHSFAHGFWFDLLSAKAMTKDLKQLHELIKTTIGQDVKWFRPPYGVTTPNLRKAVEQMDYAVIGWTVRSMDTVARDKEALLDKLKRALKPGHIFLFHDSAGVTADILPDFIHHARSEGYEIVPLDQLLNLQPYVGRTALRNNAV